MAGHGTAVARPSPSAGGTTSRSAELALTVAGAYVGAVLGSFFQAWGPIVGAVGLALVTAVFQVKDGRVSWGWVVPLVVLAVAVNVGLFSAADGLHGSSVLPWVHRATTIVAPPLPGLRADPLPAPGPAASATPSAPAAAAVPPGGVATAPVPVAGGAGTASGPGTTPGPGIAVSAARVDCGTADPAAGTDCPSITIRSTGTVPLALTSVVVTGPDADDFTAADRCPRSLPPGAECDVAVRFTPAAPGARQAVLVVHENLPAPDTGTRIAIGGVGGAAAGAGPPSTQPLDLTGSWHMEYTPQNFGSSVPEPWRVTFSRQVDTACPSVTPCYVGRWTNLADGTTQYPTITAWAVPDHAVVRFAGRELEGNGQVQEYAGTGPDTGGQAPVLTGTMKEDKGGGTALLATFTLEREP